jgi:catecholate siderophore receptor
MATQNTPGIPAYTVADAMASYKVNKNVSLQLNVYNLFDRFYVGTLNNGGSRATIGLPRSAQLTANFLF